MKTNKEWLKNRLNELGYEIEESSSFNYTNNLNHGKTWKARACYIVESDSKLGFANVNARRDKNFKLLQEFRQNEFEIAGRIYEL